MWTCSVVSFARDLWRSGLITCSNQCQLHTHTGVLRASLSVALCISKDGEWRALPVRCAAGLPRESSQHSGWRSRSLFIPCNSNGSWLMANKTAKHVSTPIIQFRNCLKTGQKPMTHLTYREWEYIICLLVFHISVMITAVIDASTTKWAITSEPYAAHVANFQRAVHTTSVHLLEDAQGCCKNRGSSSHRIISSKVCGTWAYFSQQSTTHLT